MLGKENTLSRLIHWIYIITEETTTGIGLMREQQHTAEVSWRRHSAGATVSEVIVRVLPRWE